MSEANTAPAAMRLVAISGNFTRPSKTHLLAGSVADVFSSFPGWEADTFDLIDAGPSLGTATCRADASPAHLRMWDAVRDCDALFVASPIYKASYSGLLKHFFDLMEMDILVQKPVMLGATGRAAAHALMIDHQFRPLFAFFKSVVAPTSLVALEADFASPDALATPMAERVRGAAEELRRLAEALRKH